MFIEPDETVKEKALKDLETYTWANLVGMCASDDGEEADSGWSIIALSPEFTSKLEKSTGIDAQELPKLIAASANLFVFCLLRSIEAADDEEPLRADSLEELFLGLREIFNQIDDGETVYRRSLSASRGKQELPPFL